MYQISEYSGKIKNTASGIIFSEDCTDVNYPDFHAWLVGGGERDYVPYFDGELSAHETETLTKEVMATVRYLTDRALSSSIGKQGNRIELESMKMIYQEKYNVAKGLVVNLNMVQTIIDEMNRDYPDEADLDDVLISYGITPSGSKLDKFYQFIIFRFETGLAYYSFFISLVEDFRTCALTHIERYDFDKAKEVISMAKSLPVSVSQSELNDLRAQMLAV